VEHRDLRDYVRFSPHVVQRETVLETDRLWAQVLCLDRTQRVGPVMDPGSDALFTVVAGEAVFQVDGKRRRLSQWGLVLVPAGSEVTVANASVDPLVLLLIAAPPPAARPGSG
jgi:quercetin dioxygenase-like cupin family protein